MRVLAALAVVQVIAGLATTDVQIPSGISQAVALVLGGFGLRWYFARSEKRIKETLSQSQAADARKTDASALEVYQRMERQLALDTEAKIQGLRSEITTLRAALVQTNGKLAQAEEDGRHKDDKIAVLHRRLERLSDQILAYEAGEDPRKRRSDPA